MALWLVRAGSNGEQEAAALAHDLVSIGWDLPDLNGIKAKQDLFPYLQRERPSASQGYLQNVGSQIWRFANEIQIGDLVALPLKTQSAIAIGKIASKYEFRTDIDPSVRHIRKVNWIRKDIPRTTFEQDLLHSFGAFMTVCQITRNDAEVRVKAILEGKRAPLLSRVQEGLDQDIEAETNVEELARDQIISLISRKFRGHALARLVEGILNAQSYHTHLSPPGPDGGVDILASIGPMGFGSPRIVVQVKSQDRPVDTEVLHELQSTMTKAQADSGLLVAFGGFTRAVMNETRACFFKVRLWDSGSLLTELFKNYDQLSEDLQAEIPLKRVPVLVAEEL